MVLILNLGLVLVLDAAVGAAAAELLGGAEDGAVQPGFVALEAGQDAFRALGGVACGDFGEAADGVEVAIPRIVSADEVFVRSCRRRLPYAESATGARWP